MANTSPGGSNNVSEAEALRRSDEMAELRAEVSRLSNLVSDMVSSRYQRAKSQATGLAEDLSERGAELQDKVVSRATELEKQMERTVRDRPLTAVAIAAGVGYLAGLLTHPRR